MALSLADRPWRQWAVRAVAALLLAGMLGGLGIPRVVYIVVLLAVALDAARVAIQNRPVPPLRSATKTDRGETIH